MHSRGAFHLQMLPLRAGIHANLIERDIQRFERLRVFFDEIAQFVWYSLSSSAYLSGYFFGSVFRYFATGSRIVRSPELRSLNAFENSGHL